MAKVTVSKAGPGARQALKTLLDILLLGASDCADMVAVQVASTLLGVVPVRHIICIGVHDEVMWHDDIVLCNSGDVCQFVIGFLLQRQWVSCIKVDEVVPCACAQKFWPLSDLVGWGCPCVH